MWHNEDAYHPLRPDWTPLVPNTRWADPLDGRTPRMAP